MPALTPDPAAVRLVHLVRHAHAGNRSAWRGDDRVRPLSPRGRAQADAIADALAGAGITTVWSSPYVRCVQTADPIAARHGVPVTEDPRLAEGGDAADVLDAVLVCAEAGHTVALCSHGDVIPAVVAEAVRRGATLDGPAELRKAARFTFTVTDGRVTAIQHTDRPEV